MSTTPSISETPYTIVGGSRVQSSGSGVRGVSALVLDRGSRTVRLDSLKRLLDAGMDEIVLACGPAPRYDVEQLAAGLPRARFLLLQSAATPGEQVNIGLHESASRLMLVLWSDNETTEITERILSRIADTDAVCTVPTLRSDRGGIVPSVAAPAFYGSLFRTVSVQPSRSRTESLYPFDYVGIYDRERFIGLGGFDREIGNPYWQLLDFGMRCYLWGERIAVLPDFRVDATRPIPPDDVTPDQSYARFHLKNLAVKYGGDSGRMPLTGLASFIFRSGLGPVTAVRTFRRMRSWVRTNKYRFVQDARRVTELWEVAE